MMEVRWSTFPKGTKQDAERYADKLRDTIGGTIRVGDYLAGIGAWEIFVGPPAKEGER